MFTGVFAVLVINHDLGVGFIQRSENRSVECCVHSGLSSFKATTRSDILFDGALVVCNDDSRLSDHKHFITSPTCHIICIL
jgi:hypothetical protein